MCQGLQEAGTDFCLVAGPYAKILAARYFETVAFQ
jgi:hypothetical protein